MLAQSCSLDGASPAWGTAGSLGQPLEMSVKLTWALLVHPASLVSPRSTAGGSHDHVFLLCFSPQAGILFGFSRSLLSHPSSQFLPPLLAGTADPAWRMLLIAGSLP